jgi:hypothetical protein
MRRAGRQAKSHSECRFLVGDQSVCEIDPKTKKKKLVVERVGAVSGRVATPSVRDGAAGQALRATVVG